MFRQHSGHIAQPAGAWIDTSPPEDKRSANRDTDLSYWSGLGMCYQPEWFPLGGAYQAGLAKSI